MNNLNVWWVLAWYDNYPDSGLNNVDSTHPSKEEADARVAKILADGYLYDNVEVVDVSDMLGLLPFGLPVTKLGVQEGT